MRLTIRTAARIFGAAIAILSFLSTAPAQTVEPLTPGKQVAQQTVIQGYTWQYWVYLPPTYDPAAATRWPMIISLPPYNSTVQGGAFSDIIQNTIPYLLQTPATCKYVSDRFVVVAPYIKTVGYPQYADTMNSLFRYLARTLKIDSTRIDLFGTCAGGNIGYTYATKYPDLPASIVFFAINDGWSFPFDLTKACTLKNIPMKLYNADGDPYTPYKNCQSVATTIDACSGGGNAEFVLVHDNIHEIWRYVDTTTSLYDWMLLQHKGTTAIAGPVPPQENPAGFQGPAIRVTRRGGFYSVNLPVPGARVDVLDVCGRLLFTAYAAGSTMTLPATRLGTQVLILKATAPGFNTAIHLH